MANNRKPIPFRLLAWRFSILGLLFASVPVGIHSYDQYGKVDTAAMLDSSVTIKTVSHVYTDSVGDSVWESSSGSGFLVSTANCEVWTNHHVIENAAIVEVFPRGWTHSSGIKAEVINSTPRSDIAVLKMEQCTGIPQVVLGVSDSIRPGDDTYAVGNPLGRNPDSISRGIVSHVGRYINGAIPYMQTDASIHLGNSGGALFDRYGKVIGINTAIASGRNGENLGIGYAVPIDIAKAVAAELHQGPPSWGSAGLAGNISSLTPDEAEVFLIPNGHGAIIINQDPESGPGAGKLFSHDVVYRI